MKKEGLVFGSIVCMILLVALVQALDINKDTLVTQYSAGDKIRGTINISFEDDNLYSIVKTNFGHQITLKNLLDANDISDNIYNCSISGCNIGYIRKSELNSISLGESGKVFGFSLSGSNIQNIDQVRITLEGNTGPSCASALQLDVLNTGEKVIRGTKYKNEDCGQAKYGCFESNLQSGDYQLATIPSNGDYCEKVSLSVAPAFKVGAKVTNSTQGQADLEMSLYTTEGQFLKKCTLPKLTSTTQNVECVLQYNVPATKDYLVCIKALSVSNYKVNTESHLSCGTNNHGSSYVNDYEIFAKGLKFDSPFIDLTKESFLNATNSDLNFYIGDYIVNKYGGSCDPYCIVPFRVSGAYQDVKISNVHIKYDREGAQGIESSSVYEITQDNVTITSGPVIIDMAKANFTITSGSNEKYLDIFFDGEREIHKKINLSSSFDFGITPKFAAFGVTTGFTIISSFNISSSKWNFGDGTSQTTVNGKSTTHKYSKEGQFNIEVEITRSDGMISKKISPITVGDPKSSASQTLTRYRKQLTDISNNISKYPTWVQEEVKTSIDYVNLDKSVSQLQTEFNSAKNDSVYSSIMSDLSSLEVPKSIGINEKGSLPAIVGANSFDVNALEEINSKDVDDETLRNAITAWMSENAKANAEFEQYDAAYDDGTQTILTKFKIIPNLVSSEEAYLVISYPLDQIKFASEYGAKGTQSSSYISLSVGNNVFEFTIPQKISIEELGAYVTPSIDKLGTFEEQGGGLIGGKKSGFGFVIIGLIIILILGGLGYWIVNRWYRNKYESYLFANKQDLVNIITFIRNSRASKMDEKEIRKKLKDAGWTGEQVSYAFKKINKTSEQRNDGRFIKRP